ncbi:MAG: lanthionine synthetase C family protein [Proteobacteria bacterium]|nr:lanthionine synthetase C family protein [Pseudomonadota bacterium]
MARSWQPILQGDLRDRAIELVLHVARTLRQPESGRSACLAGGNAGIGLFYAYLARARDLAGAEYLDSAHQYIDLAIDAVAETPMHEGLFSGFTGVSWVVEHLQDQLYSQQDDPGRDGDANRDGQSNDGDRDDDVNEQIDEVILDLVKTTPWRRDYDLVSGLVGLGIYGLERLPRAGARAILTEIANRLDELVEQDETGLSWHTRPELLPPHQHEAYPDGLYNLGLAHGIPGVLALLGQMSAVGIERERVDRLLSGGVAWLLGKSLPSGEASTFSWAHAPNVAASPSRSAWCYGDPGVACALVLAAGNGHRAWARTAQAIARNATLRSPSQCGVVDAGLCHGSAGLAHLCNHLYQVTGQPELADAARYWIEWTLDARKKHASPGRVRFRNLYRQSPDQPEWSEDSGFLTGAAGIGLALLAAVSDIEPNWDRVLLVSSRVC